MYEVNDMAELRFEAHEVDISPTALREKIAIAKRKKHEMQQRHRSEMDKVERELWELERSSFYHKSRMRAKIF